MNWQPCKVLETSRRTMGEERDAFAGNAGTSRVWVMVTRKGARPTHDQTYICTSAYLRAPSTSQIWACGGAPEPESARRPPDADPNPALDMIRTRLITRLDRTCDHPPILEH